MNDEEKREYLERFSQNVHWLRKQIPPEDIYDFAEQCLMAADFFIKELSNWVDLDEESKRDKVLRLWLKNVVGIRILRLQGYQGKFDVNLKSVDEF